MVVLGEDLRKELKLRGRGSQFLTKS